MQGFLASPEIHRPLEGMEILAIRDNIPACSRRLRGDWGSSYIYNLEVSRVCSIGKV